MLIHRVFYCYKKFWFISSFWVERKVFIYRDTYIFKKGESSFFIDGQTLYVFTSGALHAVDLSQSNISLKKVADNLPYEPFNTTLIYFSPYKDGIFATRDHVGHHGVTVHVYTIHGKKINTLSSEWINNLPFFVTFDENNLYYTSADELYKAKADTSDITLLHKQ